MQEASSLKNQVDELRAKFAAECSAYDLLLSPEQEASPALEDLCEKLGEQKARVGLLQKQLDAVIDRVTSLQEELSTTGSASDSDTEFEESTSPFGQDNERDTDTEDSVQPVSPYNGLLESLQRGDAGSYCAFLAEQYLLLLM